MATTKKNKSSAQSRKKTTKKETAPSIISKEKTSRKINEHGLTMKMELFCQYLFDCKGNASEAYRMAYDTSNMADNTIWSNASRLKDNSKVKARLSELEAERAKATEADRKIVQGVLMDIITADIDDLYYLNPVNGNIKTKKPSQLPGRVKRALARMKVTKDGYDYIFQDKNSAAKTLGKWNGWESPIKNEHTVNGEKRVIFAELSDFYKEEEDD